MKKFIVKNFYKISVILYLAFCILSAIYNFNSTEKFIILAVLTIIVGILYSIRIKTLNKINSDFHSCQHITEDLKGRFLDEKESEELYTLVYNKELNSTHNTGTRYSLTNNKVTGDDIPISDMLVQKRDENIFWCPYCGKQINNDWTYCYYCGKEIK